MGCWADTEEDAREFAADDLVDCFPCSPTATLVEIRPTTTEFYLGCLPPEVEETE